MPHLVEAAEIALERCGDDYIATGHFREETGYAESTLSRARRATVSIEGGEQLAAAVSLTATSSRVSKLGNVILDDDKYDVMYTGVNFEPADHERRRSGRAGGAPLIRVTECVANLSVNPSLQAQTVSLTICPSAMSYAAGRCSLIPA